MLNVLLNLAIALLVLIPLALIAYKKNLLTKSGLVAAFVVGLGVRMLASWTWFLIFLAFFMVTALMKHDIVDIVPEDAYDSLRRLQNLYREEEKQPHKLQTFQPFLYTALSRKVLRLQSDRTSIDPRKYDEIEKLQRMVPFLVETRLSKILRVAKSGAYQEKRKQMAYEERWLCEELIDLLSGWRQNIME